MNLNRTETSPSQPRTRRFLLYGLAALLCAGSFLFDARMVAWVAAHPDRGVRHAAQFFTRWGDFPPIVALLLILLLIAWLLKRPAVARILLLMLGSAVGGGLVANILRVLTGRTRPSANVAAGWYGLRNHGKWIAGSYGYSSFPSAHTAVAIGCIVPLWLLLSPRNRLLIATPATLIALCIAASRLLLNAHHLSDVLTSVWLGTLIADLICTRFGHQKFLKTH